jgi:radical SAM superfamily enzyme YgiQ (UPF0313 family)
MKVLLVTTPPAKESIDLSSFLCSEPLALEYIGAGIKDHHDVRIVDLRVDSEPGLKEVLETYQPDILGCGAYTLGVNTVKQICADAKKILPGITTMAGGLHASLQPEDYFEDYIDIVVIGEGVFPVKKLCACLEKRRSLEEVENIAFKVDGRWVFTSKTPHPPLDSLPLPARELTSHIRNSYYGHYLDMPFAHVRGSAGCTYSCIICSVSKMLNRKVYRHSIDRILQELDSINESIVIWVDDEFLLDGEWASELARAINSAGIKKKHNFSTRTDSVKKRPELIEEWAKIGLESVFVGFESCRESDLKKMGKGTTLSDTEEFVRIVRENNISAQGNFIVYPDFTKTDFEDIINYILDLKVGYQNLSVLTPLPGTKLYEMEKDNFITHNYNLFDQAHTILPTRLPLKEFFKEFTNIFTKINTPGGGMKRFKLLPMKKRLEILDLMTKMTEKLRNAYRDYDKHLW